MDRPTHREARLTAAIVAAVVALIAIFAVVLPAAAGADPPADDEYVLELPGARPTSNDAHGTSATTDGGGGGVQLGVSGEDDPPESELDALVSTLGDGPGSVAAALTLLAALCALTVATARRPRGVPGS